MELAGIADPAAKWSTPSTSPSWPAARLRPLGSTTTSTTSPPRPTGGVRVRSVMAGLSRSPSGSAGQMVTCAAYRNPAYRPRSPRPRRLSGGRLDWGIGAGWYEHEFRAYGYGFPAPRTASACSGDRRDRRSMDRADTTFDGTYFQISGAQCDPKPLQQPPRRSGSRRGRAAHACGSSPPRRRQQLRRQAHECSRKREILKEHCRAVVRDEDEIVKTWSPRFSAGHRGGSSRSVPVGVGRAVRVVAGRQPSRHPGAGGEKIQRLCRTGCTGFVPWFSDYPDTTTLELFAGRSSRVPVRIPRNSTHDASPSDAYCVENGMSRPAAT